MRSVLRTLPIVSCIAVLLTASPLAHALPVVNIDFFANAATNPLPSTAPSTAPTDTFAAGLPAQSVFSFDFVATPGETVLQLLQSGGDTIQSTGGVGPNNPLNDGIFYITGFIDLAPGTYNIQHNGALDFSYSGSGLLINSSDPTAGTTTSSFTIAQDTGSVFATVLYADTATTATTPEPGSFVLLGSGLLTLAGAIRRRIA
jgi:hypothetical protein